MKKRLVYLISSLRNDGPVNVLYNIVKYLDKEKYDITIVSFKDGGERDRTEDFLGLSIRCICLYKSGRDMIFHYQKYLRAIFDEFQPDIVHAHCLRSTVFLSRLKGNYRRIATVHCVPHEDFLPLFGFWVGSLSEKIYLYSLTKFDRVVSCSQSVANKMEKYHVITDVVPNGVEKLNLQLTKQEMRKKLGIPLNAIVIISVASLIIRKRPDVVLKSFLDLKIPIKKELFFLGEGPMLKDFRQSNDPIKSHIHFMGNIDNVDEYLVASDLFISASSSEGMPMSVLEAMSAGLPLLLSNIPAHCEILSVDKKIGQIFKRDNDKNLTKSLFDMIKQLSTYDIGHIRNVFQKNFYAGIMAIRYHNIYQKM